MTPVGGDTYSAGWIASGDSRLVAGRHNLDVAYRPTSFALGAGSSAASLVAPVGVTVVAALRKRRR